MIEDAQRVASAQLKTHLSSSVYGDVTLNRRGDITMNRIAFFLIILITQLGLPSIVEAHEVGFQPITLPGNSDHRALKGAIWYPAKDTQPKALVADNLVFVGQSLRKGASLISGQHPLVILSHGFRGNWRNQGWLASALARTGRIVVAINHPGTTSRDLATETGRQLWKRAGDLRHVIDTLSHDKKWAPHIATNDVTVIGHSLGGWTTLALAGARTDITRLHDDCASHPVLAACDMIRDLAIGETPSDRARLNSDLRDVRVRRVVALDPGPSRGFTPASLAKIDIPVLLIAAGSPDPKNPWTMETGYLITIFRKHLPRPT